MLTVQQRDLVAAAFGSAVDEVVVEHYPALTQEHQLTSRIAQRLEDKLNNLELAGAKLRVNAQELPDRGRGALERRIGADLLVSVSVEDEFSKGFLVQSKWKGQPDYHGYAEQCDRMLSVSQASYGWEFGRTGVHVFKAKTIASRVERHHYRGGLFDFGRRLPTMMKRLLVCKEGDPALGVPAGVPRREYLTSLWERLSPQRVVDIEITQ